MEDKLSKKHKRLENKKRKVEAFLRLAEENDINRRPKKQRTELSESSSSSEADDNAMNDVTTCNTKKGKSKSAAQSSTPDTKKKQKKTSDKELSQADKEAKALREAIIARKKLCMERPKLYLWPQYVSIDVDATPAQLDNEDGTAAPPLFMIDIQQVILFAIQGGLASYKPRFCTLLRSGRVSQVMVIVVHGLSLDDYQDNRDCFPHLKDNFNIKVPLVSPTQYGCSVAEELFEVPLSEQKIRNRKKKANEEFSTEVLKQLHTELDNNRVIIPLKVKATSADDNTDTSIGMPVSDHQPLTRVDLLLSPIQMLHETYPLPAHTSIGQYVGYKFTKDKYKKVTPQSPLFALDCEMCETDKHSHELAWVAVVNEQSQVVYETYVKPRNTIINYLTRFSGITKHTLENETTRIEDVQEHLRKILPPDAILCGQSFNNDLHALQMFHPYVIDTSVIFNLSGMRRFKPSLRLLAHEFLGEDIQSHGAKGHSPVEDSLTTMKLVQLKLSVAHVCYGDVILHDMSEAAIAKQHKLAARALMQQDKKSKKENDTNQGSDLKSQTSEENESLDCKSDERDSKQALKQVFFKRPGTNRTESLFDITKEMKKKVLYVSGEGKAQVDGTVVDTLCETKNDKKTVRTVRTHGEEHQVCYVELHSAQHIHPEDDTSTKETTLKKVDQRITKLVSATAEKSLVVVLFPGRTDGDKLYDGLGCFQITGWKDYAPPGRQAKEEEERT